MGGSRFPVAVPVRGSFNRKRSETNDNNHGFLCLFHSTKKVYEEDKNQVDNIKQEPCENVNSEELMILDEKIEPHEALNASVKVLTVIMSTITILCGKR
ncbi:hypothetical protein HanRHA438_Chr12g0539231 [Helianthus annuus]|nr:hypothetical protein HanRHA438_Chr12g0539231 [Helianthus annuus]